ncbi:PD-(D/E)XK motif protein, partial [Nonlabens ulvanivorans]|uniref:PD-(D/E)XK motif protein n=1 Tax=Nonlabens ulvanivorans TaxID=906888 RepID=UPI00329A4A5D
FGKLRLEVKSSSTNVRTHHFSSDQLNPIIDTDIVIVSILININAGGVSIIDLLNRINNKINDFPKQKEKLHLLVYSILGVDVEKINQIKFDYELAKESLKLYKSVEIPKIESVNISKEISNVKFVSNLMNSKYSNFKIDELIEFYINN